MKRSMKSKRVSWAPGVNLCQVALFRKEEYPSQVGLAGKHIQICRTYPDSFQSNDLPPGFEGMVSGFAGIPRIKWSCPPRFAVNPIWHVSASEESREVEAQSLRESKVLESVYPYPSSIPSWLGPSVSVEAQAELYNDGLTPIIPIIPIEEIESYLPQTPLELPPSAPEAHEISEPKPRAINPPPQRSTPLELAALAGSGPDVAAAASAAFTILNKSTEQRSMIDMNLLIKILSDPNLVGQLMNNPEGKSSLGKSNLTVSSPLPDIRVTKLGSPQAAGVPFYGTDLVRSPNPVQVPVPAPASTSCEIRVPKTGISFNGADKTTLVPTTASTPVPVLIPVSSGETVKQQPVKGIDYYKNLIRQHGGETQENMAQPYQNQNLLDNSNSHHQKLKPRETTLKRKHQQKQCVFYNSPKGCRNGTSCPFQHGSVPYQWQNGYFADEPSMKRVNLGSEIMGR